MQGAGSVPCWLACLEVSTVCRRLDSASRAIAVQLLGFRFRVRGAAYGAYGAYGAYEVQLSSWA